ncbi:hypothetical protein LG311_21110 [Sutcliffiella horikoshii]|uniref:hypothetical protein n=1 Tax=Sutcliffiella horikoshii TaxID=79883 RepID=UPI00384C4EA3
MGNPTKNGIQKVNNLDELMSIKSSASGKKADIYLNNIGISIKQHPAPNLYNRLQLDDAGMVRIANLNMDGLNH